MKLREIRKAAKPKLVAGRLAVDGEPGDGGAPIAFFPAKRKPRKHVNGCWLAPMGSLGAWYAEEWKAMYGPARLPKPGACERVRLEL